MKEENTHKIKNDKKEKMTQKPNNTQKHVRLEHAIIK